MPARVGLITIRFGTWPSFMPLVLWSFGANEHIEFHLISEAPPAWPLPMNVRMHQMTAAEFLDTARSTIGANLTGFENGGYSDVHGMSTSKISDLKPMLGEILASILTPYDFWGFIQEDVLLGRLNSCISPLLESFDVLSPFGGQLNASGVFMLFRNVDRINRLWRQSRDASRVLSDPAYLVWGAREPNQQAPSFLITNSAQCKHLLNGQSVCAPQMSGGANSATTSRPLWVVRPRRGGFACTWATREEFDLVRRRSVGLATTSTLLADARSSCAGSRTEQWYSTAVSTTRACLVSAAHTRTDFPTVLQGLAGLSNQRRARSAAFFIS